MANSAPEQPQLLAQQEPLYCDVALPVPLDAVFTYKLQSATPVTGGRVVVPFGKGSEKKLSGIVTRVHSDPPAANVKLKAVAQVLDTAPVLDEKLLELGKWIAGYYLAPIGEVYRTMLPLQAEFRRAFGYRITELGSEALYESATAGSSLRAKKGEEHQLAEYAVLDYMADGELVREPSIKNATGASREVLRTLLAKKWIVREDLSGVRDARRFVKFAVLKEAPEKLSDKQKKVVDTLRSAGGRARLADLKGPELSQSSLQTLVRNGAVEIVEEAPENAAPSMKPRTTLEFLFTEAQQQALKHIHETV